MKHVIKLSGNDSRDYWECSCGHSGNTGPGNGEAHAEKHIPDGDQWSYRYPDSAQNWSA